ncbi:MAG: ribonuclease P protein component [Candidatus Peregrinibacteria bacterium]
MLNKENRIADKETIQDLGKRGQEHRTRYFIFRFLKKEVPPSQFAITISQKIEKKAVHRNRLRRQTAEALRKNLERLKTPVQALIIARPNITKARYADMAEDVIQFFNQIPADAK